MDGQPYRKLLCVPICIFRFPVARELNRRFIYHSGPTNSGKTYEALKRYSSATSGVYCAPLRILATEIYLRCNAEVCVCGGVGVWRGVDVWMWVCTCVNVCGCEWSV